MVHNIEEQIKETIEKYGLISKKDKVLVALSGGKDSAVVAYILKKLGYDFEGFYLNLRMGEYSKKCLEAAKKLCSYLKIKLNYFDIQEEMGSSMCYLRIKIKQKHKLNNCAICGVIKKWIFNKKARELGFDKLVTGHNFDDEIETFLMNVLKASLDLGINSGPILKVKEKKFVPRIKPLFFVSKKDTYKYSKKIKLPVVYDICPCRSGSYRVEVRRFISEFSGRDKKNLMKNARLIIGNMKKQEEESAVYCTICSEPSRKKVCKMCSLLMSEK